MLLQELKSETQALHERIEHVIDFPSRLGTRDAYAKLLARFHGFYHPLEAQLAASFGTATVELDWKPRRKAHLLVEDLLSLGWSQPEINALPCCSALPEISSEARALGCLYVLEGATLGGQIIQKAVTQQLGLGPEGGCLFFSGYGKHTGEMWKQFCGTLTAFGETHRNARQAVVDAAVMTFQSLTTWVSREKHVEPGSSC